MTIEEMFAMAASLKTHAFKLEEEARKLLFAQMNGPKDTGYELNMGEKALIRMGQWGKACISFRARTDVDLQTAKEIVDRYR